MSKETPERPPAAAAQETPPPRTAAALPAPLRLGGWSFYFLGKLILFWQGRIGFHPLENLAFAALLLLPPPSPAWRRLRRVAAPLAAAALLYHDSFLPAPARLLAQSALIADFSPAYLLELLGRVLSWPLLAGLALAWVAFVLLSRWLRTGVLALAAMAVLALLPVAAPTPAPSASGDTAPRPGAPDFDALLKDFHAREAQRRVALPPPAADATPFDLIFLHICSLSWDDLRAVELDSHPLWRRFDFLFTRFNSAASYSGPAAIRLQRATCGQVPHSALYAPAPAGCYLMDSLRRAGYEPALALNHDGHFDGFLGALRAQAGMNPPPLPLSGLAVAQRAFDDSPIHDDLAVLSRWLEERQKNPRPRLAAYFNSISLHDGNRLLGASAARNSLDSYRGRLQKLLDDLERFLHQLEGSGRRAVLVLIPEHGAALRDERLQFAGLREIPSPAITRVPVGIRIVGPDARRLGETARVEAGTSYLAVSHLVARLLEDSPYGAEGFSPAAYLADLPATPYVAENEDTVVMEHEGRYYLRQGAEGWSEYSP